MKLICCTIEKCQFATSHDGEVIIDWFKEVSGFQKLPEVRKTQAIIIDTHGKPQP